MRLSCLILTKNNEITIRYALDSIKPYADEIVIIDSGSTDRTLDIVQEYTSKIFRRELRSFSDQRNYGISKCGCDYILFLDSDELVGENFKQVMPYLEYNYQTISLPRYNICALQPMEYIISRHHYRNWQNRIMRNNGISCYGDELVHERVVNHQPRLHNAVAHIFHLEYLLHGHEDRKKKTAFYENMAKGTGFPEYYLFEEYPYTTARTLELPDRKILDRLRADQDLQRNRYESRTSVWTQMMQCGRWEVYKILTLLRATTRRIVQWIR